MTQVTVYGGNRVSQVDFGPGVHTFADGPYSYQHWGLLAGDSRAVDLASCTVFVQSCTGKLTINGRELATGDSVQLENTPGSLKLESGEACVLVAGVKKPVMPEPSLTIRKASEQYKVVKPWGHELWLNGEHPAYVLKEIYLKAGNRTSLQYHDYKVETNVLFSGTADLVYQANSDIAPMDVLEKDLGVIELQAGTAIDISPPTLHRLTAKTDICLYEASTPHLDDVIRVHDDAGRGQGRIQSEHQVSKAI